MSIDAVPTTSPFLSGLLAPVGDERDDHELEIVGELPDGLRGMFVRNGPNPQFAPLGKYHPFDGDGMLHAVSFDEGGASYRNRWIESKGLLAERRRGAAQFGGLGELVMPDAEVQAEVGFLKNTANTHTIRHGGRLLALLEAAPPTEFSQTLETLGEWDFAGRLVGGMTAHPKVDPVSGEMHFFGYAPFPPYLRYHVADAAGTLVHSTEIELPNPVMIHDFVLTQHHVVFLDAPAIFDVVNAMSGGPIMRWDESQGTRLGVLPRRGDGADIRWFELDTCYVVHFFNAWETDGHIEIRAPRFPTMPGGFDFEHPGGHTVPMPWRWSLDLAAGTIVGEQTDDRSGEFPRINDNFASLPTRYLYNCQPRTWEFEFEFNGVVKYDLETGTSQQRSYAESEVSGEHVFVPDPGGVAEDDGWLLTMVADRARDASDLVVLDAHDIEAEPVARIRIPRRVPLGFHANWFPAV